MPTQRSYESLFHIYPKILCYFIQLQNFLLYKNPFQGLPVNLINVPRCIKKIPKCSSIILQLRDTPQALIFHEKSQIFMEMKTSFYLTDGQSLNGIRSIPHFTQSIRGLMSNKFQSGFSQSLLETKICHEGLRDTCIFFDQGLPWIH